MMLDDSEVQMDRRTVLQSAGVAAGASALGGVVSATPGRETNRDANEVLVGVVRGQGTPKRIVSGHVPDGASVVHQNETLRYAAVAFPAGSEAAREQFKEAVTEDKRVVYAEDNGTVHALYTPNDPRWSDQYAPQMVNADDAWDTTLGSANVTIAIVDTGIQYDHADLDGNMSTSESNHGQDFVDDDEDPYPDVLSDEYHGTHVGGIAAAETDNGTGVAGVSESALLSARVLNENGSGYWSDVADGIQWATDQGADVINMSLGGSSGSSTLKNAVEYAYNNGVYLAAAAGNDGPCSDCVGYPAAYQECVAVSALDSDGTLANYSSTGPEVELAAPGTSVLSTTTSARGDYENLSGTSMATPVVSGVAGLTLDQWNLTNTELRNHLNNTAVDMGLGDNEEGNGRVDAYNAVTTDPGGGSGSAVVEFQKYDMDETWETANLSTSFSSPVVLSKPISYAGSQSAHVRLRNVASGSYETQVEEWVYLNGDHKFETVSSLVSEAGTATTSDGTPLEAGTATISDTDSWTSVSFSQSFGSAPVVLSTIQTRNGGDPIVTRNRDVSTAGFEFTMQEEEARGGHYSETGGWLAVEPGTGTLDGKSFEAGTVSSVDENWTTISFSGSYTDPVFLADMQTTNGGDTCNLRYRNLGSGSVEVFVEEETSSDSETGHTYETVGFVVVEGA
jgi:serine protease